MTSAATSVGLGLNLEFDYDVENRNREPGVSFSQATRLFWNQLCISQGVRGASRYWQAPHGEAEDVCAWRRDTSPQQGAVDIVARAGLSQTRVRPTAVSGYFRSIVPGQAVGDKTGGRSGTWMEDIHDPRDQVEGGG